MLSSLVLLFAATALLHAFAEHLLLRAQIIRH